MNADESQSRYGRIGILLDLAVLHASRVTILGQGSMGNPVAVQLVRHGVGVEAPGRIRLVDGDVVNPRNNVGTHFTESDFGENKARAAAFMLKEINSSAILSFWEHHLVADDLPVVMKMASESDLLCHFYDDFSVFPRLAEACYDRCIQVSAMFGPRCDYAEVAFSIPGITPPLSRTLGKRKRQSIQQPQALGTETSLVANFVASLCLRLLLGNARGSELLPCYANAPLYLVGIRNTWVFEKRAPDEILSVYCVGAPTDQPQGS